MAYGVGGAIAEGLKSGFEMGRQVDADKVAKDQREIENARHAAADARAQQASDLALTHQQLAASSLMRGELASEGARYLQQYGSPEAIPVDVASGYAQRSVTAQKNHQAILQKLVGPVQAQRQQAQDDASRMKTGQLDPMSPDYSPADLVHTLTATSRRPLTDFMSQGDQPAPVVQMVKDFRAGMQTNNEGLTLKALNGLFAPELKTGVGQPSPHGGTIVGKQIVKIVPAPPGVAPQQDPNAPPQEDPNAGRVTPVLRVFVREGGPDAGVGEQRRMASLEQQRYGAPPGATGHYDAPVTQNRSTDPNDPIAHISMDEAMQRVSQMETLASAMDHPELRAKVEQGLKEAGNRPQDFLNALYSVGGQMPAKQETYENVPIGAHGTVRITKNAQGKETGREMFSPAAGTEKKGPTAQALADIASTEGLTPEEKEKAKRVKLGLEAKPSAAGGEGKGALAQKLKQIEDSDLSDADKVQAKRTALMGAGAAGLGSREAVFTNRILIAANETAKDLSNIVRLPIKSDTGVFGGRKQGPSLLDAGKEALTQAMTSQEVQSYNTRSAGLQRSLAAIEAAGLAPTNTLSHQMEAVQFRAGDSQQTRLEKLAQTRQMVEAGLETTLSNPKLGDEQRAHINSIIESIRKAIPFTIEDVDKLGVLQDRNPKATLNDVMKSHGLGKPKAAAPAAAGAAGAPRRISSDAEFDALPSGAAFIAPDGTARRKP